MVTPDAKRKAVAHACEVHGVSQRRACQALRIDRSTVRYTSSRPDDGYLREAMKAVAAERRRFGYRRIHVMLDRQGIVMNQKKLRRLYREEKLQVRRRGGRKRALGTRRPMLVPDRANARWSLDFVSDTFTDGRRFRVLRTHLVHQLQAQARQVHLRGLEVQHLRIGPAQQQHPVQHARHALHAAGDAVEHLQALRGRQAVAVVAQQFLRRKDGRQRRAELVAGHRDEA